MPLDIAIVGVAGIFPGAGSAADFWSNIVAGTDAIRDVPKARWEPGYYDPSVNRVDRFYCRRGGFIDELATFDPLRFGIMPVAASGLDPDQLLTLRVAHEALQDAGIGERDALLERGGIVMGRGNYLGVAMVRAMDVVRNCNQIVEALRVIVPGITAEQLERVRREYQDGCRGFGPDTAMGVVPNLVASRVANRLNMAGPAYTVDAACASSLIAVDQAARELISGRSDFMLAGGVHLCQDPTFWSVFTQLGALSRRQQIRPFDRNADGLLTGEGCGIVALKRLDDARRTGDRIYAVIRGAGIASDGAATSLMSPSVRGQTIAVRNAWREAQFDVDTVGYVEAHGTATPLGDRTEAQTLAEVFNGAGARRKAGLGSVKSMIGHAMPAAGIAGLIKTALAIHHRTLPPTLHCEEPLPELADTRFEPIREARDWQGATLRAGVNAFGFGGINAHVALESATPRRATRASTAPGAAFDEELLLLARETPAELLAALDGTSRDRGRGPCRLALFAPSPERREKARALLTRGAGWSGKQDLWLRLRPHAAGARTAFIFPGVDALGGAEVASIAAHFGRAPPPHLDSTGQLEEGLRVFETGRMLDAVLRELGVEPDVIAGHSLGEWTANAVAGLIDQASLPHVFASLHEQGWEHPDVMFLAAAAGLERVRTALDPWPDEVYVSHDNCPQQLILCGHERTLAACRARLTAAGILSQLMPFRSGLHTPFFRDYVHQFEGLLPHLTLGEPRTELWSATTAATYPRDATAIRALLRENLLSTVRFSDLVVALHGAGVRRFVQAGAGGLTGFINSILPDADIAAIALLAHKRRGMDQLRRAAAALFVEGCDIDWSALQPQAAGQRSARSRGEAHTAGKAVPIQLGFPVVRAFTPLEHARVAQPVTVPELAGDPLLAAFDATRRSIESANDRIFAALRERRAGGAPSPAAIPARSGTFSDLVEFSIERTPALRDHSLCKRGAPGRSLEDAFPVVPMTLTVETLAAMVQARAPGLRVTRIENIDLKRWIEVAKPFRATARGQWLTPQRARIELPGFATVDVVLAEPPREPLPPQTWDLGLPRDIPLTPTQVYERNYMFHGPDYQGIRSLDVMGAQGLRGRIAAVAGPASLLDNAGQLFGLWLQINAEKDRIAFPVSVESFEFYGDWQDQDGEYECTCRVRGADEQFYQGDFLITRGGKRWAEVRGWRSRRFETDEAWWRLFLDPQRGHLAREVAPGIHVFHRAYRQLPSWRFVENWYLTRAERDISAALPLPRQRSWLVSRIAAKDAARQWLKARHGRELFPTEVSVSNDAAGRPLLHQDLEPDLRVSLAHKGDHAVAAVRAGAPIGVDIETVAEPSAELLSASLGAAEQRLVGDAPGAFTRAWVAKECVAKAAGTGLRADPKRFAIEEIDGARLRIGATWVRTQEYRNFIIGWTEA